MFKSAPHKKQQRSRTKPGRLACLQDSQAAAGRLREGVLISSVTRSLYACVCCSCGWSRLVVEAGLASEHDSHQQIRWLIDFVVMCQAFGLNNDAHTVKKIASDV